MPYALLIALLAGPPAPPSGPAFDGAAAQRFADLTLSCASREYPNKLAYPIREGEHAQTAFAFGLVLDWARVAQDAAMERLMTARTRDLYSRDRACPLAYEPSGQDFLSPCLAEADLVRRTLAPPAFASWLRRFLPGLSRDGSSWLRVATVTDPSDGKLAHLDGLNLSRAWMLEGIASSLPRGDLRLSASVRRRRRTRSRASPRSRVRTTRADTGSGRSRSTS